MLIGIIFVFSICFLIWMIMPPELRPVAHAVIGIMMAFLILLGLIKLVKNCGRDAIKIILIAIWQIMKFLFFISLPVAILGVLNYFMG